MISIALKVINLLIWSCLIVQATADVEELTSHDCRFRDLGPLDFETFGYHADFGCYSYNPGGLFVGGWLEKIDCVLNNNQTVPGLLLSDVCTPFSVKSDDVLNEVRRSFQSESTFDKFLECSEAANACCEWMQTDNNSTPSYCPAVWDGWSCYNEARPDSFEKQVCPIFAYSTGIPPKCKHFSSKQCFSNGTWSTNTDYSLCSITARYKARTRWHIAVLYISIIFCCPALFIFWKYGSLKLSKFYLIIMLVTALILRNIFVIITKSAVIMDELTNSNETVMSRNRAGCKVLAFFEKLSANMVFACILLLGIFLHQLLTNVFVVRKNSGPKMKWYYIGGVGVAVASAVTWAIIMAVYNDRHCWMVMDDTNFQWIFDVPRLLMLLINTGLMIHIIVTLWKTFRYRPNDQHVAIRTARVSLYCAPIFATHFLFVMIRPNTESCIWEDFYYFVVYFVEAMQGMLVVLLQFYTDREVRRVVRLSYDRLVFAFRLRFAIHGAATGKSIDKNDRRVTVSTTPGSEEPRNFVEVTYKF